MWLAIFLLYLMQFLLLPIVKRKSLFLLLNHILKSALRNLIMTIYFQCFTHKHKREFHCRSIWFSKPIWKYGNEKRVIYSCWNYWWWVFYSQVEKMESQWKWPQWYLLLLIWENLCSGRSNWTKPLHFDVKCDPCFESFQTSVIDHVKRDTRSYSTVSPDKARFVGEIDISNKNIYIQHYGEPNIIKFDNTFCFKLQFRTCFCVCFTKW